MAQKFIGIDDAAAQLGVTREQLNTLRESGDVRAYRDGASWKFRTEDIDKLQQEGIPSSDDDDILGIEPLGEGDDAESILLTDDDIDLSSIRSPSTIIGKADPEKEESDLELAAPGTESFADLEELEIDLEAESSRILDPSDLSAAQKAASEAQEQADSGQASASDLELADDLLSLADELEASDDDDLSISDKLGDLAGLSALSDAETPDPASDGEGSSAIELAVDEQDDLVLGDVSDDISLASSDSGINLAPSDSGISLDDVPLDLAGSAIGSALDLAALSSVTEQASPIDSSGASDEFLLTPVSDDDADEDSSQIVALEDISDSEEVSFEEQPMASGLEDLGSADLGGADLGGGVEFESVGLSAESDEMSGGFDDSMAAPATAATAAAEETEYPLWVMLGLSGTAVVMLLCAMMGLDLIQSMWAWNEPYELNSSLMDGILSYF